MNESYTKVLCVHDFGSGRLQTRNKPVKLLRPLLYFAFFAFLHANTAFRSRSLRQRSRISKSSLRIAGQLINMPKNKGKGGKNRRRGKNENDNEKRELTFKEEGQEYAQVLKMLGNGRLEALCFDGSKRLAHIRGKLRKKVWINQGDIILLSLRDYQDEKGDVILKYSADEARSLKAYGELPESAKINETDTYGGEEEGGIGFDFGEDDDDSGSGGDVDIDDI
nr:eukaryotic translation initiation factor 1a [Quercus suber]